MGKRGVAAEVTAVTTAVDKALRRVSCGPLLLRASTLYCCDTSLCHLHYDYTYV